MVKFYALILLAALTFLIPQKGVSQSNVNMAYTQQNNEDFNIYPNPVTAGQNTVYINSKLNTTKKIEFYNVLGKRIFTTVVNGNEVNISNLSNGIYIVKITEKGVTYIRKLIIK